MLIVDGRNYLGRKYILKFNLSKTETAGLEVEFFFFLW